MKQSLLFYLFLVSASISSSAIAQTATPDKDDWPLHYDACLSGQASADEVIKACTAGLAVQGVPLPYRTVMLSTRGKAHQVNNHPQKAIDDLSELIKIDRGYRPQNYVSRATLYEQIQRVDLAERDLNSSIKADRYANLANYVYLSRGDFFNRQKKYEQAIADFSYVIKEYHFESSAYSGRCFAYYMKRQYDLALADCNGAFKVNLGAPTWEYYDLRAKVYMALGKNELANADLAEAQRVRAGTETKLSETGKKIVACVNDKKGDITIQGMFDCAGVWVTPRALVRCATGLSCPVLKDTIDGRNMLLAELRVQGIAVDHKLLPRPQDLPTQPRAETLVACKDSANSTAYEQCVMLNMPSASNLALSKCFDPNNQRISECVANLTDSNDLKGLISCLKDNLTPDQVVQCSAPQSLERLQAIKSCITSAVTNEAARKCALQGGMVGNPVMDCASNARTGDEAVTCLDKISSDVATARRVAQCLNSSADSQSAASISSCVASASGAGVTKYASCITAPDIVKAAECVASSSPEAKAAMQAYQCASKGRDASSIIVNCTSGLGGLDDNTRRALDCVSNAGGDKAKLVACGASTVLSGDAARLAGCAASSQGATSFALCAAGPKMNEEWRIAAECAAQTGGQPYAFAACAATQLTIRELTKCFTSSFKDCYGPNNTIVKGVTNAFKDVTQGPGKNNEFVKALDGLNGPLKGLNTSVAQLLKPPNLRDPRTLIDPIGILPW